MAENGWAVRRGRQTFAAPDLATICSWANAGKIGRNDEVWNPAAREWQPALSIRELAAILTKPRNCPVDGTAMTAAMTAAITVDRCPTCGGVWLDAGELDLIRQAVKGQASDDAYTTGFIMGMILD